MAGAETETGAPAELTVCSKMAASFLIPQYILECTVTAIALFPSFNNCRRIEMLTASTVATINGNNLARKVKIVTEHEPYGIHAHSPAQRYDPSQVHNVPGLLLSRKSLLGEKRETTHTGLPVSHPLFGAQRRGSQYGPPTPRDLSEAVLAIDYFVGRMSHQPIRY
jgi:hypothetical protein